MKKIKNNKFRIFVITLIACVLILVLFMSIPRHKASDSKKQVEKQKQQSLPVSVIDASPEAYSALITVLGEVKPLWQTNLKSQVNGNIDYISPKFRAGNIVKKDEILVMLEKSFYESNLASAYEKLAKHEVNLIKEQQKQRGAIENWKNSGLGCAPLSDLVLRGPQVKVAETMVEAANANLRQAQKDLDYTEIKAPYTGIIVERKVNKGESLLEGDEVAEIYGADKARVKVSLSPRQWDLLPDVKKNMIARLYSEEQNASWKAVVARQGLRIDEKTRLRELFLEVENPFSQKPPLLPGTFVEVMLSGKKIPGLLRVSESALTESGEIWYVTEENTLQSYKTTPVFYKGGDIYIYPPQNVDFPVLISIAPNITFLNGQKVTPKVIGDN